MFTPAECDWRHRRDRSCRRLEPFVRDRLSRSVVGRKHPVRDFLFEYYSFRPNHLLRWSPGPDVLLIGAGRDDVSWPQFQSRDGGLVLPAGSFPEKRTEYVNWAIAYLNATADRKPSFGCFGLHEWAMVYRAEQRRHAAPLRLTTERIADVVESAELRCTHFDAYRFFAPAAVPRNRIALSRATTVEHDQPGCVHVTMDLYKFAYKIVPWVDWDLLADAFELAWDARHLDMQASPYDLGEFGVEPIEMETRDGREEYVRRQSSLARRAVDVRERMIAAYRLLAR